MSDASLIVVASTSDLGRLLKDVTKIHSIVNSTRKRDKLRAALRVGSYKTDIKNCYDQLDWAIMEFDVSEGKPQCHAQR